MDSRIYDSDIVRLCHALFEKRPQGKDKYNIIVHCNGKTRINTGCVPEGVDQTHRVAHLDKMFAKVSAEIERELGNE